MFVNLNRVWWIISFVLAAYLCGVLIQNNWTKWDEKPVVVSFDKKSTPISAMPFPAITICPQTKSMLSKLHYTKAFGIVHGAISKRIGYPYGLSNET